jgi:hypothetical protein
MPPPSTSYDSWLLLDAPCRPAKHGGPCRWHFAPLLRERAPSAVLCSPYPWEPHVAPVPTRPLAHVSNGPCARHMKAAHPHYAGVPRLWKWSWAQNEIWLRAIRRRSTFGTPRLPTAIPRSPAPSCIRHAGITCAAGLITLRNAGVRQENISEQSPSVVLWTCRWLRSRPRNDRPAIKPCLIGKKQKEKKMKKSFYLLWNVRSWRRSK